MNHALHPLSTRMKNESTCSFEFRYAFNLATVYVDYINDSGFIILNDLMHIEGTSSDMRSEMRKLREAGYTLDSHVPSKLSVQSFEDRLYGAK